jgi:hypothetical protein
MKRTRADSAAFAVKAMVNASLPPLPLPEHVVLREGDQPFWDGVLRARAWDECNENDLVVAAQLARCQADIEHEQRLLNAEGSVIENAKGTQIMNPRVTVLEQLSRREMALMRTLRMGGRIAGDTRDQLGKRALERKAHQIRTELEDDGLLAL